MKGGSKMIGTQREIDIPVPYYSQREESVLQRYGRKACGGTCMRMVLGFYGHPLSLEELGERAERVAAYTNERGWIHSGMIAIAREYGLKGFRIDYGYSSDEDLLRASQKFAKEEGASLEEIARFKKNFLLARKAGPIAALDDLLNKDTPIITSMKPSYADTTASHLVVVRGRTNGSYIIQDPWEYGADFQIKKDRFFQEWTKRAIVVYR